MEINDEEKIQIFEAVWDHLLVGLALVDADGKFIYANKAFQKITKYSEAELRKKTYMEITHPQDILSDIELAEEVRQGKRSHYDMYKQYVNKFDELVWIILRVRPVTDQDNEFLYFASQIQEVEVHQKQAAQVVQTFTPESTPSQDTSITVLGLLEQTLSIISNNWKLLGVVMLILIVWMEPLLAERLITFWERLKD